MNFKADPNIGLRAYEEYLNLSNRMNMTYTETSEAIGISRCVPLGWLNGKAVPSASTLQNMYYKGCDVIYILSGNKTKRGTEI